MLAFLRRNAVAVTASLAVLVVGLAVGLVICVSHADGAKQQAQAVRLAALRRVAQAEANPRAGPASDRPRRLSALSTGPAVPPSVTPAPGGASGTIWQESLPGNPSGGRARAATGAGPALRTASKGSSGLFQQADPLDANDMSLADLAPLHPHRPPETSDEMLASMYTFDNFQAVNALKGAAGYLRPELTRMGWGRLGERRDYSRWLQSMRWLRDQYGSSDEMIKMINEGMVPLPPQFLDVMYDPALERGIVPSRGAEGIGACATCQLAEAAERATEGTVGGTPRLARAEAAELMRVAQRGVPRGGSAAEAIRVMDSITGALQRLQRGRVAFKPTTEQMDAVSAWLNQQREPLAQQAAYRLFKASGLPLVSPMA